MSQSPDNPKALRSPIVAFLDLIEWMGNKLALSTACLFLFWSIGTPLGNQGQNEYVVPAAAADM